MAKHKGRRLPKGLKSEEFTKLIKVIPNKDKVSKVAFLLAFGSGLRVSEILNLEKKHIQENYIEIWAGKGNVDRTVPKPKNWRGWMQDVIPINKTARTFQRRFKKYSRMADLPENYTFHSLRHGFALRSIEQGIPINQVQLLLGHSSIAVTNVYTRARPQDALNSYEALF
ncbi:site-specific integrase [Candidatus Woesearchaeota archaeon]|nr:site-specific integrase [Candidatus Woesearchaeota archaeon]